MSTIAGWIRRNSAWMLACTLAWSPALHADEPVPAKLAVQVMLKVLTYDRNFGAHGSGPFTVLLPYEPAQKTVVDGVLAALTDLSGTTILGRAIHFEAEPLSGEQPLLDAIARASASALLVVPELSDEGLKEISRVAHQRQLYTLSLDPRLTERALTLGVNNHDGRPQIVLNVAASREVNAAFEPTVLKLAKLVQGNP